MKPEYGPTLGRLLAPRWRSTSGLLRAAVVLAGVGVLVLAIAVALTLEKAHYSHGQGFPFSFSVGGKQYIGVTSGNGGGSPRQVPGLVAPDVKPPATGNALYIFALD